MVINISIYKTLDDSVIVKKGSILWFSYSCSRGFSQVTIKKKNSYYSKRVHTNENLRVSAHRQKIGKCEIGAN